MATTTATATATTTTPTAAAATPTTPTPTATATASATYYLHLLLLLLLLQLLLLVYCILAESFHLEMCMSNALKHVKAIPNKNGCRCVVVVVVLVLLLLVVVVPLTTFPVQFVFQNTCPAPGAPPSPELVAAVQHFSWGKDCQNWYRQNLLLPSPDHVNTPMTGATIVE